jgi:hypothetical protein
MKTAMIQNVKQIIIVPLICLGLFLNPIQVTAQTGSNVALGKPVTITTNGADEHYPWTGLSPADVTDGSLEYIPAADMLEDGVVGYANNDYSQLMELTITINLGAEYDISAIRYNMGDVQFANSWNADTMISPFGTTPTVPGGSYSGAWTEQTGKITASTVTITLTKTRTAYAEDWLFIGEIEIFGILSKTKPIEIIGFGTPPSKLSIPTTDEEVRAMDAQSSQIGEEFHINLQNLLQSMDLRQALQRAVNDLKNNPDVIAVTYQHESLYIYTRLGDKIIFYIDAEFRTQPTNDNVSHLKLKQKPHTQSLSTFLIATLKNFIIPKSALAANNKRALIFSLYQADFKLDLCPIKNALEDAGFEVDFVLDVEMCNHPATPIDGSTLKYLSTLHEYNVIYINTHGDYDTIDTGIPYAAIQESREWLDFRKNPGVSKGFRLCLPPAPGFPEIACWTFSSNETIQITSDYIRSLPATFPGTLVSIDACRSGLIFHNLPSAFLEKGAKVYISYDNLINRYAVEQFSVPFYREITQPGTSILAASEDLPSEWEITCNKKDPVYEICLPHDGEIAHRVIHTGPITDFVLVPAPFTGKWGYDVEYPFTWCGQNHTYIAHWTMILNQEDNIVTGAVDISDELTSCCGVQQARDVITGTTVDDGDAVLLNFESTNNTNCECGQGDCYMQFGGEKGYNYALKYEIQNDKSLIPLTPTCGIYDPNPDPTNCSKYPLIMTPR